MGYSDAVRDEETSLSQKRVAEAISVLQAGSQGLREVLTVWSVIKRKVLTRTYSYPL